MPCMRSHGVTFAGEINITYKNLRIRVPSREALDDPGFQMRLMEMTGISPDELLALAKKQPETPEHPSGGLGKRLSHALHRLLALLSGRKPGPPET